MRSKAHWNTQGNRVLIRNDSIDWNPVVKLAGSVLEWGLAVET